VATARPLACFLDPDMGISRACVGIGLGVLGLLALLPFGLYDGHHLWAAAVICALAVPVWMLGGVRGAAAQKQEEEAPEPKKSCPLQGHGALSRPGYVERPLRRRDTCLDWLEAGGLRVLVFRGPKGIGKSRFVEELVEDLQNAGAQKERGWKVWQVGQGRCEEPPEGEDGAPRENAEPYQLVSDALQSLTQIGRLSARHARMEQAQLAAQGVDKLLENLPGFGMLLGSETPPGMTLEMLAHETMVALRSCLDGGPVLLVLDDVQWADPSSLELLERVIAALRAEKGAPAKMKLGVILTTRVEQKLTCLRDAFVRQGEASSRLQDIPSRQDLAAAVSGIRGTKDTLSVELGPLSEQQREQFLANVALDLESLPEDAVKTVKDLCGGNPFGMLSFIHRLVGAGYLGQGRNQMLRPADPSRPLTREVLLRLTPENIIAHQTARLERLPEDDQLVLECATLCGRVFAISDVAEGLGLPRLEVIRRLHRIEERSDMVLDGDMDDDHFEFDSEVTREALRRRMQKKHGEHSRELVKEMHSRVAARLIEQGVQVSPGRVAYHCSLAGERLTEKNLHYSVEAARRAVAKCAWREASVHVKRAREALEDVQCSGAGGAEPSRAAGAELDYLEACTRRGRGTKADLQRAHAMFQDLVAGEGPPSHDVLLAYLESAFNMMGSSRTDRDKYQEELLHKTGQWLADDDWGRPLDCAAVKFYNVLVSDLSATERLVELGRLRMEMEALPESAGDDRRRELLLAFLLQVMGNIRANNRPKERDQQGPWRAEVEALFEQSRLLKQRHGDRQGLAVNYGSRGNFYLFSVKEYSAAREWLERDLELVTAMGDQGKLSNIHSRIGMAFGDEAASEEDAALREVLLFRALDSAEDALNLAYTPNDTAWAGLGLLKYAVALGSPEGETSAATDPTSWTDIPRAVNDAGQKLNDEAMVDELKADVFRGKVREAVDAVRVRLDEEPWPGVKPGDWPWIEDLLSKLAPEDAAPDS